MVITQKQLLERGVAEIIDKSHLLNQLNTDRQLRIKLGIDPSRPDLHLGHAVTLRKLREFQDAGHRAILIIGDYTAQIGDPTDRSEARKILSHDEVKHNAENYITQAFAILDQDKTEVHWQSEWFTAFTLRNVVELLASTTVNHLMSHETFANRLKNKQPLHAHEILYPLLQGYDSVMVKADVELGGSDQKFNVLMGRIIQRAYNQPEQDVMLLRYLPGTDGQEKMSKSLGNAINLTDTPEDMYGKVMSIPDALIIPYFELTTRLPDSEIRDIAAQLKAHAINPRDIKADLAREIVAEYHSAEAAQAAHDSFDRVFRHKQAPEDMEVLTLAPGSYDLLDILCQRTTLAASKSEARRLIAQRGVKLNHAVVTDADTAISPQIGENIILQVGPRRFIKIVWKT